MRGSEQQTPVIQIRGLQTRFGEHVVHEGLDLEIYRNEIFAIVGGSGSGKSTLLREMILLHRPDGGSIKVFGAELATLGAAEARLMRRRWGVMFQHGGLFESLNVCRNIGLPLREHTGLSSAVIDEIALWKLRLAGLESAACGKFPSELSGGMLKRASLARALALDPEILFLDEPTAGLDPASAAGFDELVLRLRDVFGLTLIMITHDLDLLWQVVDRVAVLGNQRVRAVGSMPELETSEDPEVRKYFEGARGRAAAVQSEQARSRPGRRRVHDGALLSPIRNGAEQAWTPR